MDIKSRIARRRERVWLGAGAGSFEAFRRIVERETRAEDWPLAAEIARRIPVYEGDAVRAAAAAETPRRDLTAEWATIFSDGPGVIVIRGAMEDPAVLDRATEVLDGIIAHERAEGLGSGDHFAKPGANDRVWNALEKHCLADPENFARYYSTDAIALASEAWLGRGYQVTAQVNRVNPGGSAQRPHRDYHLGFMSPERMEAYPAHVHALSPMLTLQGAIAHCDMPLESGPTMLLPYSQAFLEGYIAFGRPEFQDYFAEHHVQLPLAKGDAVFFNPAVMHGAGENRSKDIYRMANLLQVSSAFGRSIEAVNRARMVTALYPVLPGMDLGPRALANVIAASAEGYSFPTNLDRDPPVGGLIPASQAEIMARALDEGLTPEEFAAAIAAHAERTRA